MKRCENVFRNTKKLSMFFFAIILIGLAVLSGLFFNKTFGLTAHAADISLINTEYPFTKTFRLRLS